ncbi:MAG: cobalt ECF transporter T component CbiQ [Deferribacterales bacterium]
MSSIERHFLRFRYIDEMAEMGSPLHRVAPQAKLIATLFFIITVASFDKYTVLQLLPFYIFPAVMISYGGLSARFFMKSVLIVSPFAVVIGIFNPLIDHHVVANIGGLDISGGWVSFLSILLRFTLTVTAALVLISLTGFTRICSAMESLYVPKVFVVQLMFLYRYIFVLMEEADRMLTASSMRLFGKKMGFRLYVSFLGHLLLRTMDRAQRIHLAMFSRGFDGTIRCSGDCGMSRSDMLFVLFWCGLFIIFRIYNVPMLLGGAVTGVL